MQKTAATNSRKRRKKIGPQSFQVCPKCSNQKGFHILLLPQQIEETAKNFGLRLICPQCHQVYKMGLLLDDKDETILEKT